MPVVAAGIEASAPIRIIHRPAARNPLPLHMNDKTSIAAPTNSSAIGKWTNHDVKIRIDELSWHGKAPSLGKSNSQRTTHNSQRIFKSQYKSSKEATAALAFCLRLRIEAFLRVVPCEL